MEKEIIQDSEVKRMIRDHERRGLTLKKTINLGEIKKPELIEDKDFPQKEGKILLEMTL